MRQDIELYEDGQEHEIIGYIPTRLQKWGIYVIALFLSVLLIGSCFFSYPETLRGTAVIYCPGDSAETKGLLKLAPYNVGEIVPGARVMVFTDVYPEAEYGFLEGKVKCIHGVPDMSGYYDIDIEFPDGLVTSRGIRLSGKLQLNGQGEVVLREQRLIEVLIEPIRMISNLK